MSKLYKDAFIKEVIINWLTENGGNLNSYRIANHSDLAKSSISQWLRRQDEEFKNTIKKLTKVVNEETGRAVRVYIKKPKKLKKVAKSNLLPIGNQVLLGKVILYSDINQAIDKMWKPR